MRKSLIFYFFLTFLSQEMLTAQPYQSIFGSDSTTWTFHWFTMGETGYETCYYEKDTVVNGLNYKKVLLKNDPTGQHYASVFREDTLSGKVWFKSIGQQAWDTSEYLAFDFSLQVGDTFNISNMATSMGTELYKKVDSVKYINGRKYIYFNMVFSESGNPGQGVELAPNEPFTIIEGISSNMGPLWKNYNGSFFGHYLMCSTKDNVQTDFNNVRYSGICPDLSNSLYSF